jgi:energy-coupling factor transport system permease protein
MPKRGGAFVYRDSNSPFHALHPAAKVLFLICTIGITFTLQYPLILFVLLLIEVAVAFSARMSKTLTTVFLVLAGTGSLMNFLTWLPFGGDVGQPWASLPLPWGGALSLTDLGVGWATAMALRMLTSSLPLFLFLSATKPRDMTIGLVTLGMPHVLGNLFVMAIRFVPMVQNDAAVISEAQRARGLDLTAGSAQERTRKYAAILAPLIFTSLRRIQLVANSLDTKGFRGSVARHRFYPAPRIRPIDAAVMLLCVGTFALCIFARTQGWGIIIPSRL